MRGLRFVACLVVSMQAVAAAETSEPPGTVVRNRPAVFVQAEKKDPSTKSVYRVHWGPSVTLTAATLGLWGITDSIVVPTLASTKTCRLSASGACDPDGLSALDRVSVGQHHLGWERATNVAMLAMPAAALASVALDAWLSGGHTSQRLQKTGTEVFVTVQSTAVAVMLTSGLKLAVRRPRPRQYGPRVSSSVQSDLSFPSGHTSMVAASLAAAATTLSLRHHQWRYRLPIWLTAAAAVTTMGVGRVAAGWHFPSDVLGGALLGAACGIAIPLLQVAPTTLPLADGAKQGLSLSAAWAL